MLLSAPETLDHFRALRTKLEDFIATGVGDRLLFSCLVAPGLVETISVRLSFPNRLLPSM
jgi:hypothetical protein